VATSTPGGTAVEHVSDILGEKGAEALAIESDATVFDAIKRMVEANVGSLLVTERGKLTGIVTERDYLRRVTLEGRTEKETPVREIMTSELVYVTPETSIDECMAVMTERRIRHLPVLNEGREIAGVVSIGDLVKFRSRQQDFQIKLLTDYISSA
jgi:CBS domain-containing protein